MKWWPWISRKRLARIQLGYDQGVLEGIRQGYINVRGYLQDQVINEEPRNVAWLLDWMTPRLGEIDRWRGKMTEELVALGVDANTNSRDDFMKEMKHDDR